MLKSKLTTSFVAGLATLYAFSLGGGSANAGSGDWDRDWTALTVAHTGAWGTHTSPSRVDAMIGAMAECRERAGVAGSGCGSNIATVRGGWSSAYACGTETYIVTGRTLAETHVAAINREIELREIERIELGECRRLVAIDPTGEPATSAMLSDPMPLIPERPEVAASENIH